MTGFLARWSKRKLDEAARAQASPGRKDPRDAPASRRPPDEHSLSAEQLAALPRIEELRPDSSVAAFLERGVPEALRNAALRRMWLLDPAIRDFAGHARDYAYDWNTPGGVPGQAPIDADEASALLRQALGEVRENLAHNRSAEPQAAPEREAPSAGKQSGDDHA